MKSYLFFMLISVFLSCSSVKEGELSAKAKDSILQTSVDTVNKPVAFTDTKEIEAKEYVDTLPDYETFQEYLALFKSHTLPVIYDSLYVRGIKGNDSNRLRFSRFFKLWQLKEPEGLNAFYARDKFDLGNGRTAVTIVTDVAPEFVGPDGELKTVSFIVYDRNGEILAEQHLFRFYNIHQLMEYSWGKINKDLSVNKSYYNSEFDSNDWEIIDRGHSEEQINLP